MTGAAIELRGISKRFGKQQDFVARMAVARHEVLECSPRGFGTFWKS
jgi:hypothetical protein